MKNHSVRYGVYYGLSMILWQLVLYLINPRLMFNMTLTLPVGIIVPIIFMYLAGKDTKEDNEGFLSFSEALKATFVTFLIGSLISIIFTFIMYNYVDTSLLDLQQEVAAEMGENMARMFGADDAAIEQMQDRMDEQGGQFSVGNAVLGWLVSLIFPGLIIALILSAIIKKNPSNA